MKDHSTASQSGRTAGHIFVGIDGGGSGCRVAIRDGTGRDLGAGLGGPSNVTSDPEGALSNIRAAVRQAFDAAGLPRDAVAQTSLHAGLAGAIDTRIAGRVGDALTATEGFARCTVSDDREIQALGALGGADGYILAIGTGTIAARVSGGQVRGVGGWGFQVSDQGSAADLGRAALSRTLMALDGIHAPSPLTEDLARSSGGATGIAVFAARARPADFAALAPTVVAAAADGDPHAVAILTAGAAHLDAALTALGLSAGDRLCLTGGLGPVYRDWLAAARIAQLSDPVASALEGALRRAGAPAAMSPT